METFLLILFFSFQWLLGLFYANLSEWVLHKYVLHGLGKNKSSMFSFHWHGHHRTARQNAFYDDAYSKFEWKWNAHNKELLNLFLVWISHSWILFLFPFFFLAITYGAINYYMKHRKAHTNPEWAKKHLRHHYDHHMGKNQNANWCVTRPWCDILFGTREYMKE